MASSALAKKADKKGRVLIPELANSMVLVERVAEGEYRVTAAEVIPAREAWLHKNKQARTLLEAGLSDAKAGKLVKGPLDDEDMSWVSELAD